MAQLIAPASVRRVCVIGAGTMGSGIAAHLANIGFRVALLDRTPEEARAAFDRAKRVRPPHFYLPETADTIELGGIASSGDLIRQADWVCEAIIEKPAAKKELFEFLDSLIRPDAYISTNTSGLEISLLSEGRSASFRRRFLGTHFFNPPRHLKLLELIPTPETSNEALAGITEFLHRHAARRVVLAKDTPGFIANRYGMWAMFKAVHDAERLGLSIEQADEITGPFLGRPRSGSFRLNDIVGIDIMADIARNLLERCPHDPHIGVLNAPRSLAHLLDKGWIGAKAGQGYTRKEGRELLSLDLATLAYRNRLEPDLPSIKELSRLPLNERLKAALALRDEVGEYLREYLLPVLRYADSIKEEVSHSVQDFDRVMEWGFGWEAGPFAMTDMIGREAVGIPGQAFFVPGLQQDWSGTYVPLRTEPEFAGIRDYPVIESRETFVIRDLGEGVSAVSLTTKMGTYGPKVVDELTALLESGQLKRMVLTSEAKWFSAGFDLRFFVDRIEAGDFVAIDAAIGRFQNLGLLLSSVPSVAAVFGYCLGGGFEMAASCSLIAAHPESQIGLPEARVGLIPGGTGTLAVRLRAQSGAKTLAEAVAGLAAGRSSTCADEARAFGLLRREDVTVYHPDALIPEAMRLALTAEPARRPAWQAVAGPVSGLIDQLMAEAKKEGSASDHDILIASRLKDSMVKAGSFEDGLARERAAFVSLCREGLTLARMKHMLENGRPLRN